jgi:hypothetical protein
VARIPREARLNFDGVLALSNSSNGIYRAYVQAFRTGAIEAVASSITDPDGRVDIRTLDAYIVHYTRVYAMALHACGAEPPLIATASVIGVKDREIGVFHQGWGWRGQGTDRDQLHLAEIVLEEVPSGDPECGRALRPLLQQLANAAGLPTSPNFDQNGNWTSRQAP